MDRGGACQSPDPFLRNFKFKYPAAQRHFGKMARQLDKTTSSHFGLSPIPSLIIPPERKMDLETACACCSIAKVILIVSRLCIKGFSSTSPRRRATTWYCKPRTWKILGNVGRPFEKLEGFRSFRLVKNQMRVSNRKLGQTLWDRLEHGWAR